MKIRVIGGHKRIPKMQLEPIYRARAEIRDLGYQWVEDSSAELTLLQSRIVELEQHGLEPFLTHHGIRTPVLLFDSGASCALQWEHTTHPQVVGVVRKQLLRDVWDYRLNFPYLRAHYRRIAERALGKLAQEHPKQAPGDPGRLLLAWNSGASERFGDFRQALRHRPKTFDVHCSIRVRNPHEHYVHHRRLCADTLRRASRRLRLRTAPRAYGERYFETLRRARCALSPWGLGEACLRNFEAIYAGAIVIAPDTSHLVTEPDIFRPWETYVPCAVDFSDLEKVLAEVLGHYDQYRSIAERAYECVQHAWCNERIAGQFDAVVRAALEGQGYYPRAASRGAARRLAGGH